MNDRACVIRPDHRGMRSCRIFAADRAALRVLGSRDRLGREWPGRRLGAARSRPTAKRPGHGPCNRRRVAQAAVRPCVSILGRTSDPPPRRTHPRPGQDALRITPWRIDQIKEAVRTESLPGLIPTAVDADTGDARRVRNLIRARECFERDRHSPQSSKSLNLDEKLVRLLSLRRHTLLY